MVDRLPFARQGAICPIYPRRHLASQVPRRSLFAFRFAASLYHDCIGCQAASRPSPNHQGFWMPQRGRLAW
jgi:hypothetical protein